jgi:hypothetical protein
VDYVGDMPNVMSFSVIALSDWRQVSNSFHFFMYDLEDRGNIEYMLDLLPRHSRTHMFALVGAWSKVCDAGGEADLGSVRCMLVHAATRNRRGAASCSALLSSGTSCINGSRTMAGGSRSVLGSRCASAIVKACFGVAKGERAHSSVACRRCKALAQYELAQQCTLGHTER